MVPAVSLDELENRIRERYEFGERRIVGIMLARYDIPVVEKVIGESYYYWHHNSERGFDMFWPGYGEYLQPDMQTCDKQILNFRGNSTGVYFDMNAFISIKREISLSEKILYHDKFELLLVNYYDGHLHYNENIRIDLEKNIDEYHTSIRTLIEFITEECKSEYDVASLSKKIIKENLLNNIKGIKISEFISSVTGIASLL